MNSTRRSLFSAKSERVTRPQNKKITRKESTDDENHWSDSGEDMPIATIKSRTKQKQLPTPAKPNRKRLLDEDADLPQENMELALPEFNSELSKMFGMLGNDMNKAKQTKRKRYEEFVAGAIKIQEEKFQEMYLMQYNERKQSSEKLLENIQSLLEDVTTEMHKLNQMEEKLLKMTTQHVKMSRDVRNTISERINSTQEYMMSSFKKMQSQDADCSSHYKQLATDMKKQLMQLQKKMLAKAQQEEMANLQNSLKSFFFMQ